MRNNRVVYIFHDTCNFVFVCSHWLYSLEGLAYTICGSEHLNSCRPAYDSIVIRNQHIIRISIQKRKTEETEEVLLCHTYVQSHLFIFRHYRIFKTSGNGTPFLNFGIAALQFVS